jgi:two-component system sensor histidine kinase BaeS
MRRLSLRAQLALALVGVAILAVALAGVLGHRGLHAQLRQTAHTRQERSAAHFAAIATALYLDSGSWDRAQPALVHLAAFSDLLAEVRTERGRVLRLTPPPRGNSAQAPIVVSGRRVATVTIAQAGGRLFTPEERQLHRSLDRLHLVAGAVAIAAALGIAFLLAGTFSRPLRRLRQTAERMERGDLKVRVETAGAHELAAVGRALNRLAETLAQQEETRKANTADLSHELRTPVNSLLARIEAAQDGVIDAPANLAAMHTEALRLTRLLDDLARLADAERPGLLLEKRPVDLAEVARAVADSFAPRFRDSDVSFAAQLEPAWVLGDSARLEEIAANLLSNAFRYTERGQVRLRVAKKDNEAILEVDDTGIGIAPEDLPHIFTRFWRGDRSRSRTTGGAGIGLAIVRELVRAHDGHIDIDSTPGRGSRFRIIFPALAGVEASPRFPKSGTKVGTS